MQLISPDSLEIAMSETLPLHLEGLKISNSKILCGTTAKGTYIFQDLYCQKYHACFIHLLPLADHKIILLKHSPDFFLMVQLRNTLDCVFNKLANGYYPEWSINLYHSQSLFAEINLQAQRNCETFVLFIPNDAMKRLCKKHPSIFSFYLENNTKDVTTKLIKGNPICNFQAMDCIRDIQFNKLINSKTYIELISAAFELLANKNLPKQAILDDSLLQKMYDLKQFMVANITNNYTRSELCKQANLSEYHFEKSFSKIYNVSPFLLLRYYRMTTVRQEKQTTPLKELAAKYHYSYNSLIRTYRSVYRIHPSLHNKKPSKRKSNKGYKRKKRK